MGSIGVQFRGIPAVMAAYDNIKILSWAVMYGKNINMKYTGISSTDSRDALQQFLNQLKESDTVATYTLSFYEDLPKGGKIKPSTEPDYSFNFLVTDDEAPRYGRYREIDNERKALQDKVTAMEARLAAYEEDDDEDNDSGSLGGVLSGILKDERIQDWLKTKAIGLADSLFKTNSNQANVVPMNQIGKVGSVTQDDPILINEDQQLKMQQAIEILARCDANLGDNLLKIARIAENDPGKYQMFSKML